MPERRTAHVVDLRFCRTADRALDAIEAADPEGGALVSATLRALLATPPRAPLLPLRCRSALDGGSLAAAQAGRYTVVLAGTRSDLVHVVAVVTT